MKRRLRLASLGFLVACSPAPAPKPVVAELVVPPMGDAGAPVAPRRALSSPPEPPARSAEEVEREECHAVMQHIAEIQIDAAGLPPEQRRVVLESVLQSFDQMSICPMLDGPTRSCMLAAKTAGEIAACASVAGSGAQPPPPPSSPPRPSRPKRR